MLNNISNHVGLARHASDTVLITSVNGFYFILTEVSVADSLVDLF